MSILVSKTNGSLERQILIGMIVDSLVIANVAPKWTTSGLFHSNWANVVGGWCVQYYNKYGSAPNKEIESMFMSWSKGRNGEVVDLVQKLLVTLSGTYKRTAKSINARYLVDLSAEHFNEVQLTQLSDQIRGDVSGGDIKAAMARIAKFNKIEVGAGAGIDVFSDLSAMKMTLQHKRQSLFSWPGALGTFYGDELEREGFLAYIAPEKRGKTWTLIDLSFQAALNGRRVAMFQVGDLSQIQILRRLYTRVAERPLRKTKPGKIIKYPKTFFRPDAEQPPTVEFEERTYKRDADLGEIRQACRKLNMVAGLDQSVFRLSVHPNSSINVSGIKGVIDNWSNKGWHPDVVVIDYADILSPPTGFQGESRDAINENWKQMRRLSQELHCLVVTATQAKAASYEADLLDMTHFADDKRKFAHVTAMVGINQNYEEKLNQTVRYNWIVLREDEFLTTNVVYVAQCLSVANAAVLSAF